MLRADDVAINQYKGVEMRIEDIPIEVQEQVYQMTVSGKRRSAICRKTGLHPQTIVTFLEHGDYVRQRVTPYFCTECRCHVQIAPCPRCKRLGGEV